jgi:hypothetical protein
MGDGNSMGRVTRSAPQFGQPSFGGPTANENLRYDWSTGSFQYVDTTWANALSEASTEKYEERTDSITLSWNASLWDDRIVPVIGFRHDNLTYRQTTGTQGLSATDWIVDGYPQLDVLWDDWNEQIDHGNTWTKGVTVDVLRINEHELTVFYNESENFNPQPGVNIDYYGNRLTRPGGEGKDYGFSLGLWNNKLTVRVTWFEALSTGDVNGPANGAIDRLSRIDTDYFFPWAETIARIEQGQLDAFVDSNRDPYAEIDLESSSSIQARIEELTGLPYNYYSNLPGTIRATQTNKAEGLEIAASWNPNANWTFRAAISSQETAYSEVGPEVDAWIAERSAFWDAANSPLSGAQNMWLFNGERQADLSNFWSSFGYNGNATIDHPQGWDTVQDYYDLAVAGNINLYKAQQGRPVDNQRKWRANFIGRYTFTEGALKGSFVGGGLRWEDKVAIGYYGLVGDPDGAPDLLNVADLSRPIYDKANTYVDLWAGYRTMIMKDRAELLIQLNVRNVFESGDLRPVGADFAGNKHTFRIVDPREIYLTTTIKF